VSLGVWKEEEVEKKGPQKEAVISGRRGAGKTKMKIVLRGNRLEVAEDPRDQADGGQGTSVHFGQ